MRSDIEADLETLCRSCGLCCDGSLFGRVPLAPAELPGAKKRRLHVLGGGRAFEQPCAALSTLGTQCACSIYPDRPGACRAFTCRLYERLRRDGGSLAERLESVRQVRELLALVATTTDEPARRSAIAELTARMQHDFARAEPSTAS